MADWLDSSEIDCPHWFEGTTLDPRNELHVHMFIWGFDSLQDYVRALDEAPVTYQAIRDVCLPITGEKHRQLGGLSNTPSHSNLKGIMIEVRDFDYTHFVPGWECEVCGWQVGSINQPAHACPRDGIQQRCKHAWGDTFLMEFEYLDVEPHLMRKCGKCGKSEPVISRSE